MRTRLGLFGGEWNAGATRYRDHIDLRQEGSTVSRSSRKLKREHTHCGGIGRGFWRRWGSRIVEAAVRFRPDTARRWRLCCAMPARRADESLPIQYADLQELRAPRRGSQLDIGGLFELRRADSWLSVLF